MTDGVQVVLLKAVVFVAHVQLDAVGISSREVIGILDDIKVLAQSWHSDAPEAEAEAKDEDHDANDRDGTENLWLNDHLDVGPIENARQIFVDLFRRFSVFLQPRFLQPNVVRFVMIFFGDLAMHFGLGAFSIFLLKTISARAKFLARILRFAMGVWIDHRTLDLVRAFFSYWGGQMTLPVED